MSILQERARKHHFTDENLSSQRAQSYIWFRAQVLCPELYVSHWPQVCFDSQMEKWTEKHLPWDRDIGEKHIFQEMRTDT